MHDHCCNRRALRPSVWVAALAIAVFAVAFGVVSTATADEVATPPPEPLTNDLVGELSDDTDLSRDKPGVAAGEGDASGKATPHVEPSWPFRPIGTVERTHNGEPVEVGFRAINLWRDLGQPRGLRYLAVELVVRRPAGDAPPVTIPTDAITLASDGVDYELPEKLRSSLTRNGFEWFGSRIALKDYLAPQPHPLAAGETMRTFLVYYGLPSEARVPSLTLAWPGLSQPIDLRAMAGERLKLARETLGPKQAVTILGVRGPIDSVSVATLIEELDRIEATGSRRIVLSFQDDPDFAGRSDEQTPVGAGQGGVASDMLVNWLTMVANDRTQIRITYLGLPPVSSSLLELQLLDEAGTLAKQMESSGADEDDLKRIFHTDRDAAVTAALSEALAGLTREPLLQLVRTSPSVAIRNVALAASVEKLAPSDEPLLRQLLADDATPASLRRTAIEALGRMRSPTAIATLVRLAGRGDKPIDYDDRSDAAIALVTLLQQPPARLAAVLPQLDDAQLLSLTAMQQLLRRADPASPVAEPLEAVFRDALAGPDVKLGDLIPLSGLRLGQMPERSAQATALNDGFLHESLAERWPGLQRRTRRATALRGLAKLDVDDLPSLVFAARDDAQSAVRRVAREILQDSVDPAMREQAIAEVLAELKAGDPTRETLDLVDAVADPRVVPPLVERFPSLPAQMAIATLNAISPLASRDQLAELAGHYDDLADAVKVRLLVTLATHRLPDVYDLAERELFARRRDDTLVRAAAEALTILRTKRAEDLLFEAFEQEPDFNRASAILRAVSNNLTLASYRRLGAIYLRPETDSKIRTLIGGIRSGFETGSPGHRYIEMAENMGMADPPEIPDLSEEEKRRQTQAFREQIAERQSDELTFAIAVAPELPLAYHRRGFARLTLNVPRAAVDDFRKAIELGTIHRETWAMLAIAEMGLGRVDAGREAIAEARRRIGAERVWPLVEYNVACAYAKARETLTAASPPPAVTELSAKQRTRLTREFTDAAFDALEECEALQSRAVASENQLNAEYLRNDPDLTSLRGLPRWEPILAAFGEPEGDEN